MLLGLLIAIVALIGVVALSIRIYRADRSAKGRTLTGLMLDPFSLNQISNPIKGKAAAYIEEMQVSHDKEDEGQGDAPPEDEESSAFERALEQQMESTEAFLRKRGARGKHPDNGVRV
ncbi:MAG TPA: hypothetical protein VK191_17485 [Symbiobacteriaceae bacterium]|nr:hypothetical protein [Symbiobacteriaceae bacterium]